MKVFRLEDSEGIGPYHSNLRNKLIEETKWYPKMQDHHRDDEHPNAWEDGISSLTELHKFGFTSEESLVEWFREYIDVLEASGFSVKIYEDIEEYEIGISGKQLIFIP